jgi:hypothetical protein
MYIIGLSRGIDEKNGLWTPFGDPGRSRVFKREKKKVTSHMFPIHMRTLSAINWEFPQKLAKSPRFS